jgi:signal transduction histidine kinase
MKTLSLYNKLIIYFLVVSLVPLGCFGFLSYYQLSKVNREHTLQTINLIAVETAYKIERELELRRAEVHTWAGLLPIEAGLAGEADLNGKLDRIIAGYPMYDLLLVTDAERRVVAANRISPKREAVPTEQLIGSYVSDGPWFTDSADLGFYRSEFRRSGVVAQVYGNNGEGVNLATAVPGRDGKPIAYLIAYLNWRYIQDFLMVAQSAHAADLAGQVFMLNVDTGRFIAHPNTALHGQPYPLKVDLPGIISANPTGVLNVDWPQAKTIGYAQVRGVGEGHSEPWVVCTEVADEVIYRHARLLRSLFLFLTLLAAFLIIVIVYFISRRISEPLLQLVVGAQAIAAGNMDIEIPVKSVDELGILANTFNQMLDSLRQRDEQLRLTNQQLEEANRLKSQFLANVSHELRTPMNSIIGFTTLVLQRSGVALPDQQRDNLGKVRRNALHLLKLLNSILDLSKIESGGMDVTIEGFDLRGLVEGCLHTISPLVEGRPIELDMAEGDASVGMMTDRQKLQQVLINLLGNAVKFTERGYIRVGCEVVDNPRLGEVGDRTPGPWVRAWVEDSGIGIHERDLPHIFSEFRQVDGSPSRKYGGTGLGLSISRKLAKLLGGDIVVRSEPGFGSTFTVVIPVRHAGALPLVRDETAHVMPGPHRSARIETVEEIVDLPGGEDQ